MPQLDYGSTFDESGIDGKKPQSWDNYVMPFLQTVRTLTNTTKLDYLNIQDNGLRTSGLRTHDNIEAVRIKVRNATGSSIAAGALVYFSGTYSDSTDSYPLITKAVATTAVGTTFFAQATTTATIGDDADGTAAVFLELTGQDTSSATVGDVVYLSTTAGGWTRTRPTGGQYIQVVGTITVVHASTGRVVLSLGSVPEHLTGGSSGLGATFQTLTVQGASGAAADIYHFGDAGEDAADKWKVSVADGGVMTWENYTSGSYVAKMTITSAGVVTTTGAITSSGVVTGSSLAGTISTVAQNSITSASSLATVGTITAGAWQSSTVVASAYLDADTAHLGVVQTFTANKTFTGTVTVGVDDTGKDVKFFGASAGAYMEWDESADQLRIMGASADATTSTGKLLLATSLNDINANDVLGKIDFQAPHEATGTDATTIAASIQAVAQATFTEAVNATDLIFSTGHSEAATEKFRMTSEGELGIGGANYGSDGQVLTSGGAGAAAAWEAAASAGADVGTANTWTADQTFNDNIKVTLGTGGDADIYYDGTNTILNPKVAGSGYFQVLGTAGVGIARTDGTLHVHTASAGTIAAAGDFNDLVIENSGNCGISILSPAANTCGIYFGDPDSASAGAINYLNNDGVDAFAFATAGSERMRIDSAGLVGINCNNPSGTGSVQAQALVLGNTGLSSGTHTGITMMAGTAGISRLDFGDTAASAAGGIYYLHNENSMNFVVNEGARLVIDSSGDFTGSTSADISDERLKENVVDLTGCLAQINALRGISYNFTPAANKNDMVRYGLIAQEVEAVIPAIVWDKSIHDIEAVEAVDAVLYVEGDEIPEDKNIGDVKTPAIDAVDEEIYKSLHYTGLIPVFIEAIKELTTRLEAAEAKITTLEAA